MAQKEIEEIAQKMAKGDRNLVEWLDKLIEEKFRKSGFRIMADEEWEEQKDFVLIVYHCSRFRNNAFRK